MNKFQFVKLQPDKMVVSNRPSLIMTEKQLNGDDLQGAHQAVMAWLHCIEDEIPEDDEQRN